jgi:hypothetical protein
MSKPESSKRGRQAEFSDAAIQFCLTIKYLFNLPLPQTTGFIESWLRLANLDWKVPDASTICRRQKRLKVVISARKSMGGLQ